MEYCELTEEEFRIFLDKEPLRSFLQLPEMAHYKKNHGWEYSYVGMKEKGKIVCGTMLLSQKKYLFQKVFYAPYGILVDYEKETILQEFFQSLKKDLKRKWGMVFLMEPYFPIKRRDTSGNLLKFEHEKVIPRLQKLGFSYRGTSPHGKYLMILNLKGKTKEEIWNAFDTRTKSSIKQSLRKGITIRELEFEELSVLKELTSYSSYKHHFQDKPLSYYEEMYQLLKPKKLAKFVVCEIHPKEYLMGLEEEKKVLMEKQKKGKTKHQKDYFDQLKQLEKKTKEAQKLKDETIALSSAFFLCYQGELTYLYSGNRKEANFFESSYRIQWEMIQYAIQNHYHTYNFYGILTWNKKEEGYSVYQFKKGFHGEILEMVGEFVLPLTPIYSFYQFLKRIFLLIKKSSATNE